MRFRGLVICAGLAAACAVGVASGKLPLPRPIAQSVGMSGGGTSNFSIAGIDPREAWNQLLREVSSALGGSS